MGPPRMFSTGQILKFPIHKVAISSLLTLQLPAHLQGAGVKNPTQRGRWIRCPTFWLFLLHWCDCLACATGTLACLSLPGAGSAANLLYLMGFSLLGRRLVGVPQGCSLQYQNPEELPAALAPSPSLHSKRRSVTTCCGRRARRPAALHPARPELPQTL